METYCAKTLIFAWMAVSLAPSALALTWGDVKSKAAVHAPAIRTAKTELDSADASLQSARAEFLPSVSSSISTSRDIDSAKREASNHHDASIYLEQSIFSFGRTKAQTEAAQSGKRASLANLKLSSSTLRAKLAKAWAKALYLQELVKIGEKNTSRREANVQIVKLRYQGGRENKGSVLRTEASKLQTQTDVLEAKANLDLSKGDLSVLIGQQISTSESLSGDLRAVLNLSSQTKRFEHPQVAALVAKHQQAEASLIESRRKYFPELSLSASAKKTASPDLPLGDPQYSAGLTLKIPLFNGATSADVASAAAKSSAAAIAAEEAKAAHEQKLKQAESAFAVARKRLEVSSKIYEASKMQAEVSRQRYTLGLMSFQDWDSYETELMKSEADVLRSKLELANSHADYLESLGVSLEEGP